MSTTVRRIYVILCYNGDEKMSDKPSRYSMNLSIERLKEALKNYNDKYDERLITVYNPGELYPAGYISAIDHYMRMFMVYPLIPADTLVRLRNAYLDTENISDVDMKRVRDFTALINELVHYIG